MRPSIRLLIPPLLVLLLGGFAAAAFALDEEAAVKQFRFAKGLFDRELYAEALEESAKFVDFYKESRIYEKGLFLHAEILYRLDRFKEAAGAYEEFLKRYPQSALAGDARYSLAWSYYSLKEREPALKQFRALFDAPDREVRADARYRAALLIAQAGGNAEAEPLLEGLAKEEPPPGVAADALFSLSKIELALGKRDESRKSLQSLLKRFPAFPERATALFNLGEILYLDRKPKEALEPYRQGLKLVAGLEASVRDDLTARFLYSIAYCHHDLGQFAEAADNFRAVVDKYPKSKLREDARLGLGKALFQLKKYAEAIECLKGVTGAGADEARFTTGYARYKNKEYDAALAAFAAVPAGAGEIGKLALFYRGVVLFEMKRYADAAGLFDQYLAAGGKEKAELARFNRAQCRFNLNDRETAKTELAALADQAGDPEIREKSLFSLAEIALAGEAPDGAATVDAAVAALGKVPEKSRRRVEALLRAGDILRGAGRAPEALDLYRKAVGDPSALKDSAVGRTAALRAGRLLAEMGQVADAEAMLARVDREEEPAFREARYERARLARARGDFAALPALLAPLEKGGIAFKYEAAALLAEADLERKDYPAAEARLAAVIAEAKGRPAAVEAHLLLARVREAQGKLDEALQLLEAAQSLSRSNEEQARAQYQMGRILEAQGQADRATRAYLKVDILYRDTASYVPAMIRFARLSAAAGKKREAAKALEPALAKAAGAELEEARALYETVK